MLKSILRPVSTFLMDETFASLYLLVPCSPQSFHHILDHISIHVEFLPSHGFYVRSVAHKLGYRSYSQ